jgi:vacuolar-type H+-ATPase subunit I/STV1
LVILEKEVAKLTEDNKRINTLLKSEPLTQAQVMSDKEEYKKLVSELEQLKAERQKRFDIQ